ncbi:hypothetical protein GLYMA_15G215250v4 [Glycine max]|nr:hypothetical protein GLYMA_15G215250v4 [Glycine max]
MNIYCSLCLFFLSFDHTFYIISSSSSGTIISFYTIDEIIYHICRN